MSQQAKDDDDSDRHIRANDSILSEESEEINFHPSSKATPRQTSFKYGEQASMEVSVLMGHDGDTTYRPQTTTIRPAGVLGRRHSSRSETMMVEEELDEDGVLLDPPSSVDSFHMSGDESDAFIEAMMMSERDVFRSVPPPAAVDQTPKRDNRRSVSNPADQGDWTPKRTNAQAHNYGPDSIIELFENCLDPPLSRELCEMTYEGERKNCTSHPPNMNWPNNGFFILQALPLPDNNHADKALTRAHVRLLIGIVSGEHPFPPFVETRDSISSIDLEDTFLDDHHITKHPHVPYQVSRAQLTLEKIFPLWELTEDESLRILLARLLGLVGTTVVTPHILKKLLDGAMNSTYTIDSRRSLIQAIKQMCSGSGRLVQPFFSFSGVSLSRTISGIAHWPFRNDFGVALWFRAETVQTANLLSVETDSGSGIRISLLRLDESVFTIEVSIVENGTVSHQEVVRNGCVLLPHNWYFLGVRHTRSRLKGVFSLSSRQQLSVFIDSKILLNTSVPFPKIDDSRHSSMNLQIALADGYLGQTSALYLFHDNVSDATFRALYEVYGKKRLLKRSHSLSDCWDARKSDQLRKSRILDVATKDDADEIVLSSKNTKKRQRNLLKNIDLGEGEDEENNDFPLDLQYHSFGSKVFMVWDPLRTTGDLALELHIGAHVNLGHVQPWEFRSAQDGIASLGGIQALLPVFRSFLVSTERSGNILPDLLKLLSSFVRDHNVNARELLRCGGIDVIEHLIHSARKYSMGRDASAFGVLNMEPGEAPKLARAVLELRSACSHYVGLETKIYSRLLFNIPLWLGNHAHIGGVYLHTVFLPVYAELAGLNPGKVRDCIGTRDVVNLLKSYTSSANHSVNGPSDLNRFLDDPLDHTFRSAPLSLPERRHCTSILLGILFNVLASGTKPRDFSALLNFISANIGSVDSGGEIKNVAIHACTVLLLLLQLRPKVPGLFESFAHTCGGVQGGVSWILNAMVNSMDDEIRALGVRCVAAYLDVTSRGDDSHLSLGMRQVAENQPSVKPKEVSSTVHRATTKITQLAKGLASMGPNVRTMALPPSKLTAKVVYKLLWHFLKTHRSRLGSATHDALLLWIVDNDTDRNLSSIDFVQRAIIVKGAEKHPSFRFVVNKARSALGNKGNLVGKSLRNPLAIGTVFRLLRFLEDDHKDQWIADLLALTKANRKCVSSLASLAEWQQCLFSLISETLEVVSTKHLGRFGERPSDETVSRELSASSGQLGRETESHSRRLDLCLQFYSTLLGHLLRSGGDHSLEAVEKTVALERVFVNGHHVLLLIFGSLCNDIFENGTLLEVGTMSAQDWREVNLEHDSLLLKQSARLITDSILSNGTQGLDLATAVRSWRSLRHLTEVVVGIVTRDGLGVVDLFGFSSFSVSRIDPVTKGMYGIRLPPTLMKKVNADEYVAYYANGTREDALADRQVDRRLSTRLTAQILTLLDSFIFPQSFDSATHVDGLALVRFSEARLGKSQGPLISSAMRLSFLLLSSLEPCSMAFLQCVSRLRCLLVWGLELVRDTASSEGQSALFHKDGANHIDRLILATVLHCHLALGRCATLLSEIDGYDGDYFESRDEQKKYYRRVLRVTLELREVVSTAFKGRNDLLQTTLSSDAFDAMRFSLEGKTPPGRGVSKESAVIDFLKSSWVSNFQGVEKRSDLPVPEQVCVNAVPLSSNMEKNPLLQGFVALEKLSLESRGIVADFEKVINVCFEQYLEGQRKWADTDAVRDLEYDGDTTVKRLSERHKADISEISKDFIQRKTAAEIRWNYVQKHVCGPWKDESHWKLPDFTDRMGRRVLLVPNKNFDSHASSSYDTAGKDRNSDDEDRRKRILEKKDLSEVMRRNAEAFVVEEAPYDEADLRDDESSLLLTSDGETSTDVESSTDIDSLDNERDHLLESLPTDDEQEEGWDKIVSEDFEYVGAEGDTDTWAKAFIWAENEAIVAHVEPVMVITLQTFVTGRVLLTTHGLYFHQTGDEMNVITRQPIEINPEDIGEPKDRRWRLSRISEIHGRRFLLRHQALEIFFSDGTELLLNFPGGAKDRDRFHAKLRHNGKVPMLWSPKSLNPRTVFRRSKLTELWRKRKISNFEYLMALNRMAGRSFSDLTQYPVFPWVLADYTSDSIDLSDSRVYRDLTKPVGALNPDRLAQLLERYSELELFGFSEAEKFLYGSHYSSPGIVLHFMIRQEPFTSMAIDLQSGRFDCPDRLFFDVAESWNSCLTSTSDMKELIPEFFCFPELFRNSNKFPLGKTQAGRVVDDVELPPWAKGSAYEFVRIHRLASESEYVSQNLHHWIDLIFGYKQRGAEAESSHNLFHHLSYEGSVDLDKIADEVDRVAAESHIQNFGQTPSQLIVEDSHPARYSLEQCWSPLIPEASAARRLKCHTPSKQFANRRNEFAKGPLVKVEVLSDTIIAVYGDMSVGTYRWAPTSKTNRLRMDKLKPFARRDLSSSRNSLKRGSTISPDQMEKHALAIGNWSFGVSLGGYVKDELKRNAVLSSGRLIAANDLTQSSAESSAYILSCGYFDDTIKVHSADGSKMLSSENGGHQGLIRCLAVGQDGAFMITGGSDCTTRVWVIDHSDMSAALSDGFVQTALGGTYDGEQFISCCHVLWGHDQPVCCVGLDCNSDIGVSGSESGRVCVYKLRKGEFIRAFNPPPLSNTANTGAVSKLAVGTEGKIVVHMHDKGLHTFTVNAERLCSVDATEHLNDMIICSQDEILVTGGDRCQVLVRQLNDLQVCAMLDLSRHGPIRCLALTPNELNPIEQFLFIGNDDGMITIVDEDPLSANDSSTVTF